MMCCAHEGRENPLLYLPAWMEEVIYRSAILPETISVLLNSHIYPPSPNIPKPIPHLLQSILKIDSCSGALVELKVV